MAQAQSISADCSAASYRATSGLAQGFGTTPQEALASLMPCLPASADSPIIILPYNRGDTFFTDA